LFSQQISDHISKRVPKNFQPREEGGDIFMYNSIEEVPITRDGEWYLLARNNYHLDEYREYLRQRGILFSDKGVPSIKKTLIEAIRMYEHRRQTGECTEINKLKIQQKLKRNADITLPWYDTFELDDTEIDYIRDILANNGKLEQSKITVNTFHGVKGGEADDVVVVMSFTRRVSQAFDSDTNAELRCLYVGCTRSKKNLHIVFKNSQYGYEDVLPIREMARRAYDGKKTVRDTRGKFVSFESNAGLNTPSTTSS
jgi:superfamily I DNA/RNA helicase